MTAPTTMRAVVIHQAGGPEVLQLETRRVPTPNNGQVLIRVKAFGLNRSELFTRRGLTPTVPFPWILGIEAVGIVANAPGGAFTPGDIVATAMGGMGAVSPMRTRLRQTRAPLTLSGFRPRDSDTQRGQLSVFVCTPGD
jgi:NADPH:quinone reductase-like Zn-dependent oxidoreductase